jgi:CubicO group peptidase (beta-lactamase class C family)
MTMDRRTLLLGGGALLLGKTLRPVAALAQAVPPLPPPSPSERGAMGGAAIEFMQTYDVPGLGVAIAHRGVLVYEGAFGFADKEARIRLAPTHRFRIASLSKPITSAALFTLIEKRALALQDRVFGDGGVLGNDYGVVPSGSPIAQITIEHLLTHTAGGWSNDDTDPMFHHLQFDQAALIAWTLKNLPLISQPGSKYAYSNFGYCVLGRVIEKITRRRYGTFVQEAVLSPVGIKDMVIAGNGLVDRLPQEVRYYGQAGENPYNMNVRRMDSHGGWLARPAALALFATKLDGFTQPLLLAPTTLAIMSTASVANSGYAKGWEVNEAGNWWHNGSLPGTVSIMVRTNTRFCWAALINTRRPNSDIVPDLDKLIWAMVRKVEHWSA